MAPITSLHRRIACEGECLQIRHSRVGGNPFVAFYQDKGWKMGSRLRGNDGVIIYEDQASRLNPHNARDQSF